MYRFSVLNRMEIENTNNYKIKSSVPYIVISITSSDGDFAALPECRERIACLQIKFDDINYQKSSILEKHPHNNVFPITPPNAAKILDFVFSYKDRVKDIVVHCDAGLSRSPGVALALNKILNGPDVNDQHVVSLNGLKHANLLVRDVILNTYRDLYQL